MIYCANPNQKAATLANIIAKQVKLQKKIVRNKDRHYMIIKGLILQKTHDNSKRIHT
jgi:hypothetical protein